MEAHFLHYQKKKKKKKEDIVLPFYDTFNVFILW